MTFSSYPGCTPHVGVLLVGGAPPVEPVTLEDAKLFLRVTVPDEEADIARFITAARLFCERRTGRPIARQTCDVFYDTVPIGSWITLPFAPVIEVTSITTTDPANVSTILDPASYLVDVASEPARIGLPSGGTWPSALRAFQAVAIRLIIGYDTPPEDLVQAIRFLLGHYHENRQAVITGTISTDVSLAVDALLTSYELVRVI